MQTFYKTCAERSYLFSNKVLQKKYSRKEIERICVGIEYLSKEKGNFTYLNYVTKNVKRDSINKKNIFKTIG